MFMLPSMPTVRRGMSLALCAVREASGVLRAGRFSGYRVQAVIPNFRLFNEVLSDRPVFHVTPSEKLQRN